MDVTAAAEALGVDSRWLSRAIWHHRVPLFGRRCYMGGVVYEAKPGALRWLVDRSPDAIVYAYRRKHCSEAVKYEVLSKRYGVSRYEKGQLPSGYADLEHTTLWLAEA